MERLYRVLSRPHLYKWATALLAPGGGSRIVQEIRQLTLLLPTGEPLLDVGCGPRSWLDRVGLSPVGLDVDSAYVRAYQARGGLAVHGSADEIPFRDGQFAGVWCIGVLHHLDDPTAQRAICEMQRVRRPQGYVAIMDAVLPRSALASPIPFAIRRLDRGRHMRSEAELRALFPDAAEWQFKRFCYSATGLEMLCCLSVKQLLSR